jgi:nitrite reductase/ring-hydroxylating ferredoxin subunit/uncharacterized membrane protein
MQNTNALTQFAENPAIDRIAEPLSQAVREMYQAAGPLGQQAKNAVHGVWLGHPLHPVFTDVPIGAWTTALALDAAANGDAGMRRAATFAMGVGLVGAVGAAVSGLTDWSETGGQSRRSGLVHGLLNIAATTLFATAYVLRRKDSHDGGRKCAWAGYAIAAGAAYLGGDLVYAQRVGVTHADASLPEKFTPVMESAALPENAMARGRAPDADVLVVRQHGQVCALVHSCSHLGGPLSEGTLNDGSVVCPWHGSEFALEDGRVLNGPATQNQPCLIARERDGRIEVKAAG